MKGKKYPKVLQNFKNETEELLDLDYRTKKHNLTGTRLDILFTNRITAVGVAMNHIIEDASLDHSL